MKKALVLLAIFAALVVTAPAEPRSLQACRSSARAPSLGPNVPSPGVSTTELAIISAKVLPSGEPHGSIANLSPLGTNIATVTCVAVVGDTVYVGGPLRPAWSVYNGETMAQMAFGVRDGGTEGDLVAGALFRRADVDPCQRLSLFPAVFPLGFGNFVVRGL